MEKRDGENKDIEDDNMLKIEIEMKLQLKIEIENLQPRTFYLTELDTVVLQKIIITAKITL